MTLHESIVTDLVRLIEEQQADILTPASLAIELQHRYAEQRLEPHIEYASLEHLKNMARKVLAGNFDAEGSQNKSHQGELFSGRLQDRYPVPRKRGEEAVYKLREVLSREEVAWNIGTLRKSAEARLLHADALEAWDQSRSDRNAA